MRLWADEARGGTLELLMSLPAPAWALVLGKFLAAWTVAGAALALTAPMWISVNWLGAPDNAAIALGYLMSFLMAGAYLSIACALSAAAGNQVVAFVLSVAVARTIALQVVDRFLQFLAVVMVVAATAMIAPSKMNPKIPMTPTIQ